MKSIEDLYKFLYNKLIDISLAKIYTIHYLIGPKWEVCEYKDTVKIAKDTLLYLKENIEILKLFQENTLLLDKINKIFNTLLEISKAKKDSWDDGLFDKVYYYYAKDTVDKAKNCLDKLNLYL